MGNKPLDMRFLEDVANEPTIPELTIVEAVPNEILKCCESRWEGEFKAFSDYRLDDEIKRYTAHIENSKSKALSIHPGKLEKRLYYLQAEKHRRMKFKNAAVADLINVSRDDTAGGDVLRSTECAKTDGTSSFQIALASSDELRISNSPKLSLHVESLQGKSGISSTDKGRNRSRILSGEQAEPSSRQGLRSSNGTKKLRHCFDGGAKTGPETDVKLHGSKENKVVVISSVCRDICSPSSSPKESSKQWSSREGTWRRRSLIKRRGQEHAAVGESMDTAMVLFSSEDDEQEPTALMNLYQRKTMGRRDAVIGEPKIAYPSRDDPDAIEIFRSDLDRLNPMEFLNDTVIDFYIKYIQRPEALDAQKKSRLHFFNSFFYKKLSEMAARKYACDLSKLRKWTKGIDIFKKDYLFVPIHDKLHWSLAIVGHPGAEDCFILHLDSMIPGHKSGSVFKFLRRYLAAEWDHIQQDKLDPQKIMTKKLEAPQQQNESDCGLFLLHYIERFIDQADSKLTLTHIEEKGLFNRNWFEPSDASNLRGSIRDLIWELFVSETNNTSSPHDNQAQTIESQNVFDNCVLDFSPCIEKIIDQGQKDCATVADVSGGKPLDKFSNLKHCDYVGSNNGPLPLADTLEEGKVASTVSGMNESPDSVLMLMDSTEINVCGDLAAPCEKDHREVKLFVDLR